MRSAVDSKEFRSILGHYPTGVCAITSMSDGKPLGMIVGSFTSVSLDPPLVAFLPDRKSRSWSKIEATGGFCVNVLSEQQEYVCKALASKVEDKFETISYRLSQAGLPILDKVLAWIDCDLFAVHEAGDHFIAIGQVRALDVEHIHPPLLFFRGNYGSFSSALPQI
jgi:3-hydroxy-9,10-secoandrosta-1,3,5(10)-triene-9,17-dione monooxygenase reductase component